jgi:methionine aminopeptidase
VYGDTSAMVTVGKVDKDVDQLITTTYDCLYTAIDICKPGT